MGHTWIARVSFDTSRKQTDPHAYRWSIMRDTENTDAATNHLAQTDAVVDGIVRYAGRFSSRSVAEAAIRSYMLGPKAG
jgi:hypothetical protein